MLDKAVNKAVIDKLLIILKSFNYEKTSDELAVYLQILKRFFDELPPKTRLDLMTTPLDGLKNKTLIGRLMLMKQEANDIALPLISTLLNTLPSYWQLSAVNQGLNTDGAITKLMDNPDKFSVIVEILGGPASILEIPIKTDKNTAQTIEDIIVASNNFLKILPIFKNPYTKEALVNLWLDKNNTTDDFIKILQMLSGTNSWQQEGLVKLWLAKNNVTVNDLVKTLQIMESEIGKKSMVLLWLNKNNLTFDDLVKILHTFKIDSDWAKEEIAQSWFNKGNPTPAEKCKRIVEIIKNGILGTAYDADFVINFFERLIPDDTSRLNLIPSFVKDLYPNSEYSQVVLFADLIKNIKEDDELRPVILNFLKTLQSNECCQDVIQFIRAQFPRALKPIDILNIANERIVLQYTTLNKELNIDWFEALSDKGYMKLKKIFKEMNADMPAISAALKNMKLSALFGYADIYNEMENFCTWVKPDILKKIRDNYQPSHERAYITLDEKEKLEHLGIKEKISVKLIANFLKSQMKVLPLSSKSLKSLDKLVKTGGFPKEAMKGRQAAEFFKNATKEDVAHFFKTILSLEHKISGENEQKLYDYFTQNKKRLAFVMSKEGGLDYFIGIISTLGDGCVANIATQANIATHWLLLKDVEPKEGQTKKDVEGVKDPAAKILYFIFTDKIARPLLQALGEDRLGGSAKGINIFKDEKVIGNFISPLGLFSEIMKEFYFKNEKNEIIQKMKPAEFIQEILGENLGKKLVTNLEEELDDLYDKKHNEEISKFPKNITKENKEKMSQEASRKLNQSKEQDYYQGVAELASYLVLTKAISATPGLDKVINHPSFQEMRDKCETRIEAARKPIQSPG